jgi:hypothetical protein
MFVRWYTFGMHQSVYRDQRGHAWVAVVVIAVILGLAVFTWWSIDHSKEKSDKILAPGKGKQEPQPAKTSTY